MQQELKKIKPRTRGGIWILIVAAVVLEATACIQYFYCRSVIRTQAEQRAQTELRRAEQEIEKHTVETETTARMLAALAERYVDCPDTVFAATRLIVKTLSHTSSVAVAYVPDYFPKYGRYFEACSSRISADSIYTRQIGTEEHNYTQMEWYLNGLQTDGCKWSEPYLDNSGSQTFVVSCSCPVHDANGRTVAVVCVDLALEYLQQVSHYLQLYKGSFCSIRSMKGENIVARPDTVPGRKYTIFDEEIDATGWHISIIIPEDIIYADLKKVGLVVTILMLLGLGLLVFIMYRAAKNVIEMVSMSNQQERLENELIIARDIQMAMLPTRFPPFDDYPNLNASGVVIPAKEVGGDLFDFYIRENKLIFCIGDVSGKGVPAALVMAVTRSLFRSLTSYMDNPAQIISQMNDALLGGNDRNMFVTLFLGILDLATGELRYCNAGHDAPILIHDDADYLPVSPNLPLGILSGFVFAGQQTRLATGDALFLYTDGLTEAENADQDLFGMDRMMDTVRNWNRQMTASEQISAMRAAVDAFVRDAQQSDDLTMFAIRFLDKTILPESEALEKEHYSLVMRNDIQQIPTLAEWIDTLGIPQELGMSLNLALEEAVTNVMLYAYPKNNSGRVLVEADKQKGRIVFTISDSGIPFDPTKQKEPDITLSLEERAIGGLGIFLVRQIMDEISYQRKDNKNILTLIKKL